MKEIFKRFTHSNIGAALCNILLAYGLFMICRVIFLLENWTLFGAELSWHFICSIFVGGLVFDTTSLLYLNSLYLVLMLFPLHIKERKTFHKVLKCMFVVVMGIGICANLIDTVYSQYIGRRSTFTIFSEFGGEGNLVSIFGVECLRHWYLVLAFVAMIFVMWKCYRTPDMNRLYKLKWYYLRQSIALVIMIPLAIIGIRGGITPTMSPIAIINANDYVEHPSQTAIVLNSPFTIIRTVTRMPFIDPQYMSNADMTATYTPVHHSKVGGDMEKKNVVILLLESFGKEYSAYFSGNGYASNMPFVDSIASRSLTYKYSFANGSKSVDAMASVQAGIPMILESFFYTQAATNTLCGLPGTLDKEGYYTAMLHGAPGNSMGFRAFSREAGMKGYYGMEDYCKDPKYRGEADFDGRWAIWDEEFLQYSCDKINEFKAPFMSLIFTATSHHPFKIPEKYKKQFPEGALEIHKCVQYADMSLRRFFDKAKTQKWYENTLFVIVGDHTNISAHRRYDTEYGQFEVPIIFYTPDGSIKPEMRSDIIAQQTDIMPTVLSYLGYNKPYFAFGSDLLTMQPEKGYAVNYVNNCFQYIKGDYAMQFDGKKTIGLYNFKTDTLQQHNLAGRVSAQPLMEKELKAIIQQYMQRMNNNALRP